MKTFHLYKNNHQIENITATNREINIQTTKSNRNKSSHFKRKEQKNKKVIKQEERLFREEDIRRMCWIENKTKQKKKNY